MSEQSHQSEATATATEQGDEPLISLLVCTRNRAHQLASMLRICEQLHDPGGWELVIVDNGSTDDTRDVLSAFLAHTQVRTTIVYHQTPGLARARNAGLRECRGSVVAFTDDDCYPAPDFLKEIGKAIRSGRADFLGGYVSLHDPADAKMSIQEHKTPYAIEPGSFIASGQIIGANMTFTRKALSQLGGFDERLGAGTFFCSGEDTDLLRRASLAGLRGEYVPMIKVAHHHGRRDTNAVARLKRGYERGIGACLAKLLLNRDGRALYLQHGYWLLREAGVLRAVRILFFGMLFVLRYRTYEWSVDGQ